MIHASRAAFASLLAIYLITDVARADIPPPPWIENKRRVISSTIAALNAHDPTKLGALYAKDVTLASVGRSGWQEERGREVLVADHQRLFARMPDVRFTVQRMLLGHDAAIFEWSSGGFDKDGKPRAFRAASVFTFDDAGQILTDHTYFDAGARPALPALPPSSVRMSAELRGGEEAIAVLRKLYAARAARKDAEVAALFASDAVVSSLYEGADLEGRAALERALAESGKTIASLTVEPTRLWCFAAGTAEPIAAAEVVVRAKLRDGRTATMHSLDLALIRGGQIHRYTSYGNSGELAAPSR